MKRLTTTLFILFIVVAALGCHKETEQVRVKKVISEIQTAAEEKDLRKILKHLSKTYSDPQGFNHENIKGLLLGYFFKYPRISVYINNLDISVDNTSARVMFRALLTSGKKTGSMADVIPQSLGTYSFDISLKKESNNWMVTSVKWTQVEMIESLKDDDS